MEGARCRRIGSASFLRLNPELLFFSYEVSLNEF